MGRYVTYRMLRIDKIKAPHAIPMALRRPAVSCRFTARSALGIYVEARIDVFSMDPPFVAYLVQYIPIS